MISLKSHRSVSMFEYEYEVFGDWCSRGEFHELLEVLCPKFVLDYLGPEF